MDQIHNVMSSSFENSPQTTPSCFTKSVSTLLIPCSQFILETKLHLQCFQTVFPLLIKQIPQISFVYKSCCAAVYSRARQGKLVMSANSLFSQINLNTNLSDELRMTLIGLNVVEFDSHFSVIKPSTVHRPIRTLPNFHCEIICRSFHCLIRNMSDFCR